MKKMVISLELIEIENKCKTGVEADIGLSIIESNLRVLPDSAFSLYFLKLD